MVKSTSRHLFYYGELLTISIRQNDVEVPLRQPNCFGSILCLTSSIIHWTTKSSRILDREAVSEIGRSSSSQDTGSALGIGVISASFQISGNSLVVRDVLKIKHTGSANS